MKVILLTLALSSAPDLPHKLWRSAGQIIGGTPTFRAYTHAGKDGPKAMLFVDSTAPHCAATGVLITMDPPSLELPGPPPVGTTTSTMKVDDGAAIPLPMKLETVGAGHLVWSIDGQAMALTKGRADMAKGIFVAFTLARGPGKAPLAARFRLDGYREALERSTSLCRQAGRR